MSSTSRENRKEIEDQLRAFYRAAPPLAVDYLVRRGDAPDAILRTADEVGADLIVVGTHGRSGLDRMLCGSVAESVLQRSSRPVLVVRQTDVSRTTKPIRIVVHPTDFSGPSRPRSAWHGPWRGPTARGWSCCTPGPPTSVRSARDSRS